MGLELLLFFFYKQVVPKGNVTKLSHFLAPTAQNVGRKIQERNMGAVGAQHFDLIACQIGYVSHLTARIIPVTYFLPTFNPYGVVIHSPSVLSLSAANLQRTR